MNGLDPVTMSAVTAMVVTVCGALYLIDTIAYAGNAAARLWAVAFSAGTLTAFAYMLWTFVPGAWVAAAAGNASFVASVGFLWLGCRRFNRPVAGWPVWILAGAIAATFVATALPGSDGGDWAGAGVMFAAMAVFAGMACAETRRAPLSRFAAAATLTFVMGAVCVYYTARTAVFATLGPDSPVFTEWFGTPSTSVVTIVLTTAAVTSMVVLRIQDQAAAGARGSHVLTLGRDGYLDRASFAQLLGSQLERGRLQRGSTAVTVLLLDDVPQISAAFGPTQVRRIVAEMRAAVLAAAPATALLGTDGEERVLLCHPRTSDVEALRAADRLSHQVLERLHTMDVPVVPVLGVGVVATSSADDDADALVDAASRAAAASAANDDAAAVLADAVG